MRRKDGTCSYISEETGVCRDVISRERTALGIGTDRVKSDRRARRGQGFWRSIIWRGRRSSSVQTGRFSVELGRIHVATLSAIAPSAVIRLRAFCISSYSHSQIYEMLEIQISVSPKIHVYKLADFHLSMRNAYPPFRIDE